MKNKPKKHEPEYHKNCHNCGQFLKRDKWVRKDHEWKKHGLCAERLSNYDMPGEI
jgi:hypothetical protein